MGSIARVIAQGDSAAMLSVQHLVVEFKVARGRKLRAVSDVSFDIRKGETLGLLGESGCGKSTVARALIQLPRPVGGAVVFEGSNLASLTSGRLRAMRSKIQLIYQDPISSLNPLRRARSLVLEGLMLSGSRPRRRDRSAMAATLLNSVGLNYDQLKDRRPFELSGGQCQRISIARAIAMRPELLICDEPVSSLDVLVQAQILNLLEDLKKEFGLTMLFIAHNLGVVRAISDRIAVMYLGKIVEIGPAESVYDRPMHPYTRGLLDAVPQLDGGQSDGRGGVVGEMPSPLDPPSGCRFRTRCQFATQLCAEVEPEMRELRPGQLVACHHPLNVDASDGDARKELVDAG